MLQGKRKSPRIISRSKKAKPEPPEELRLSHHDEIDEELRSEIIVKGGIVMRVEKQGSVEPPTFITAHEVEPERHQIPLPGVAEEIESYPCPFCTDRVFLTAFGLEKHALERHNDQMGIVNHRIQQISEEWERRRTHDARRAQQIGIIRHQGESMSRGGNYANPKRMMTSHQSKFGICKICAIVINISHPMAMENHMKVHEKNDELRQRLLQDYGPIVVAKLTCKECNLVFMDEEKLQAHYIAAHPRRRKYLCKWCGEICLTLTDLNTHKLEMHGVEASGASRSAQWEVPPQSKLQPYGQGRNSVGRGSTIPGQSTFANMDPPMQTNCQICGLLILKPSLLIRHMVRTHNQHDFAAEIRTRPDLPPISLNVERGHLSWFCCNTSYATRDALLYHRRLVHGATHLVDDVATTNHPTNPHNDDVPMSAHEVMLEATETEAGGHVDPMFAPYEITSMIPSQEVVISSSVAVNDIPMY